MVERSRRARWNTWHQEGLPDYAPVGNALPVVENSIVQLAAGPARFSATLISNGEVTAGHALIEPRSVGFTVLKQGTIGFYIPLHWSGDLRFNGVAAIPNTIHMPVEDVHFHINGSRREVFGCILPRSRFVDTLAALRGVDPHRVRLPEQALRLPQDTMTRLQARFEAIIGKFLCAPPGSPSSALPADPAEMFFELMVEAVLQGQPGPGLKSEHMRNPGRIVRVAEELFAANAGAVSLADLCAATGVGKSVLYLAFRQWCGEPPITYFHKRRLAQARTRLFVSAPRRGGVKQAALDAGLTEFGRFARDYRRLFGESPSATLNRKLPWVPEMVG